MNSPVECSDFFPEKNSSQRRSFLRESTSRQFCLSAIEALSVACRCGVSLSGVVRGISRLEFAAFVAEAGQIDQTGPLQRELQGCDQHAESVFHAAAEVDGGSFCEILRGTGNFADAEAEVDALGEHLVVEDEVVGIFQQRQVR